MQNENLILREDLQKLWLFFSQSSLHRFFFLIVLAVYLWWVIYIARSKNLWVGQAYTWGKFEFPFFVRLFSVIFLTLYLIYKIPFISSTILIGLWIIFVTLLMLYNKDKGSL